MYTYMRYVCVECGQLIGRYGRDTALSDSPQMIWLGSRAHLPLEIDHISTLTDMALAHQAATGHSDLKRELAMSLRTVEMDIEERNPA